jgi:hypothetical protein
VSFDNFPGEQRTGTFFGIKLPYKHQTIRYFEHCTEEVRDACWKKVKEMEGLGASVIDIEIENRDISIDPSLSPEAATVDPKHYTQPHIEIYDALIIPLRIPEPPCPKPNSRAQNPTQ